MGKNQSRHSNTKTATKVAAASGLIAVFGAAAASAAPAAVAESAATGTSGVQTQVRKSVTLTGNPDGSLNSSASAMVTQVSSVGNGQTTVTVPVGADSARNLDGFSSVPVQGQSAVFNMTVNGSQEQRIYTKADDGPIKVKATATLDGKPINPGDIVDKTGVLAVQYTMVNTEKFMQTVTYKDAAGNDIVEEQLMTAPIGGSVEVVLPQGFNEISAPGANIGGDGTGATKLSYSPVLFEPLGSSTSTISYQTRITNGTLPKATFTFLPIVPLQNSSVVAAKEGYSQAGTGFSGVATAGVQLGEKLDLVSNGAGELATKLGPAVTGSEQIAEALNDSVLPNFEKLAAGTETLVENWAALEEGTQQLADGTEAALDGVTNLPALTNASLAANSEYQTLLAGLKLVDSGGTQGGFTVPSAASVWNRWNLFSAGTTYPSLAGDIGDSATDLGTFCADAANFAGTGQASCAAIASPLGSQATSLGTYVTTDLPWIVGSVTLLGGVQTGFLPPSPPYGLDIVLPQLMTTVFEGQKDELLGAASGNPKGIIQLNAGAQLLAETVAGGTSQIDLLNSSVQGALAPDQLPKLAAGAETLAEGLPAAVTGAEAISTGAGQIKTEGTDKLTEVATAGADPLLLKVAQIDALQSIGAAGKNIPYGPATGPNTTTSGVYQMTLQAASSGASNSLVWGLAALGLVVAGGAGVWVWRRQAG